MSVDEQWRWKGKMETKSINQGFYLLKTKAITISVCIRYNLGEDKQKTVVPVYLNLSRNVDAAGTTSIYKHTKQKLLQFIYLCRK